MKQYYYIAYLKPRCQEKIQLGDGVIFASSIAKVKRLVGEWYGVARNNVNVTLRHKSTVARDQMLKRHEAEQFEFKFTKDEN